MFTKCGEYWKPWQILWIWCRILAKGACQCQPHPRTHWGRCYCYYLFVVLTHHLWHFQSIPATPDPVAVLPEILNANVMPVLGVSSSFSASTSSSTEALKNAQLLAHKTIKIYFMSHLAFHTPRVLPKLMNCALKTQHMLSLSVSCSHPVALVPVLLFVPPLPSSSHSC